jgi:hypothetical protein
MAASVSVSVNSLQQNFQRLVDKSFCIAPPADFSQPDQISGPGSFHAFGNLVRHIGGGCSLAAGKGECMYAANSQLSIKSRGLLMVVGVSPETVMISAAIAASGSRSLIRFKRNA